MKNSKNTRGLLLVMLVAMFAVMIVGCVTQYEAGGVYASDPFLGSCDQTLDGCYSTIDQFLIFARDNQAELAKSPGGQGVLTAAEQTRTNAPTWFSLAYLARAQYVAAKGATNALLVQVSSNRLVEAVAGLRAQQVRVNQLRLQ
jgi:hypothetical protein